MIRGQGRIQRSCSSVALTEYDSQGVLRRNDLNRHNGNTPTRHHRLLEVETVDSRSLDQGVDRGNSKPIRSKTGGKDGSSPTGAICHRSSPL